MLELVKGEEQDNELNCSKSDKNLAVHQYAKKVIINIHLQIGQNLLN